MFEIARALIIVQCGFWKRELYPAVPYDIIIDAGSWTRGKRVSEVIRDHPITFNVGIDVRFNFETERKSGCVVIEAQIFQRRIFGSELEFALHARDNVSGTDAGIFVVMGNSCTTDETKGDET